MNETVPQQVSPESPQRAGKRRRRRTWKWWLANLMIVAGVLVLAYPAGTWGYTWWEQRQLRAELEAANPAMMATAATIAQGDFISIKQRAENAERTSSNVAASASEQAAAEAALKALAEEQAALERERKAQLDAFAAAASAYRDSVTGKTGVPIGKILIPSIGVDVIVLEGTSTGDLREGPGHWEETPFPGQGGNFVVSGHRTTYGAPFRKLNDLKVGDSTVMRISTSGSCELIGVRESCFLISCHSFSWSVSSGRVVGMPIQLRRLRRGTSTSTAACSISTVVGRRPASSPSV